MLTENNWEKLKAFIEAMVDRKIAKHNGNLSRVDLLKQVEVEAEQDFVASIFNNKYSPSGQADKMEVVWKNVTEPQDYQTDIWAFIPSSVNYLFKDKEGKILGTNFAPRKTADGFVAANLPQMLCYDLTGKIDFGECDWKDTIKVRPDKFYPNK